MIAAAACTAVAFPAAAPAASAAAPRQHIRMDDGWRFLRLPLGAARPEGALITGWQYKPAPEIAHMDDVKTLPGDVTSGDYRPIAVGADAFDGKPGYAWFKADLGSGPAPGARQRRLIQFMGFDDDVSVWVNGVHLITQVGYNTPLSVDVTRLWRAGGPNAVVCLVQNDQGAGGISSPAFLQNVSLLHSKPEPTPAQARPGYDDHAWRTVHLPHDYVVEGTFTSTSDAGHGSLPMPPAWYRKTFTLPAADRGKAITLRFDGVYRDARVYLNGHLLGEHLSGYAGFRYGIDRIAHYGGQANTLAVRVDPSRDEGWFYEGGGIYRHVWLDIDNPVHIADDGGVYVTTQMREPNRFGQGPAIATVVAQTRLVGPATALPGASLRQTVIDESTGREVGGALASGVTIGQGGTTVRQSMAVPRPRLWSPDAPHLYRLISTVTTGGQTVDQVSTTFGFRTLRFDPNKGFFLNGRRTEIQGTCNHQDFAGVGIGIPDSLLYWRVAKLKAMGCNAYRCAHNPVTPALLDACDRLGMMVMDENRHLGDTYQAKATNSTQVGDLADLRDMLLRDRNHPSIIMWSLCNEEFATEGTPKGAQLFEAMKRAAKPYDATRPYTCAMDSGFGSGISDVEELQGFNYRPYKYDGFHSDHPLQPCFGSETSSEVTTRGEYADNPAKGYVQAYDIQSPQVSWGQSAEDAWQPIVTRPWMEGGFVWTGFDYKGEPTPYGWPDVNSSFGIMDEAGFPKDNYYYYESVWLNRSVAHIVPSSWNLPADQVGKPVKVWVYSNADSVELFLNGSSLGSRTVPKYGHAEWSVPYAPGTLKAVGKTSWSQMVTDQVETTGPAVAVRLTIDPAAMHPRTLIADGEDAVVVDAAVVDAQGRTVPDAANLVTFTARGAARLIGTGNGNSSDHTPDHATARQAFHGLVMTIVQAGNSTGNVTVTASAPGLKGSSVNLSVSASPSHLP